MIRALKAKLVLELAADRGERVVVPERGMDGKSLWMDLADRNVDVDVVGVAVNSAHPLVLTEPERVNATLLDEAQCRRVRLLPVGKEKSR